MRKTVTDPATVHSEMRIEQKWLDSKRWPKWKSHRRIRASRLRLPWSRGSGQAGGRPKEVSTSSA